MNGCWRCQGRGEYPVCRDGKPFQKPCDCGAERMPEVVKSAVKLSRDERRQRARARSQWWRNFMEIAP